MKRTTSVLGAAALGVALLTFGGGSAQADPYDCVPWQINAHSYSVSCSNGTGTFRAYSKCHAEGLARDYTAYGRTVRVGEQSTAICVAGGRWDTSIAPRGWQIMSV